MNLPQTNIRPLLWSNSFPELSIPFYYFSFSCVTVHKTFCIIPWISCHHLISPNNIENSPTLFLFFHILQSRFLYFCTRLSCNRTSLHIANNAATMYVCGIMADMKHYQMFFCSNAFILACATSCKVLFGLILCNVHQP